MKINRDFAPTTITFETEKEWREFKEFLNAAEEYYRDRAKKYLYSHGSQNEWDKLIHFRQLIK